MNKYINFLWSSYTVTVTVHVFRENIRGLIPSWHPTYERVEAPLHPFLRSITGHGHGHGVFILATSSKSITVMVTVTVQVFKCPDWLLPLQAYHPLAQLRDSFYFIFVNLASQDAPCFPDVLQASYVTVTVTVTECLLSHCSQRL
jgi:hypothetical protein